MKVVVSCPGRYWAFRLAGQLEKRGKLRRLYTEDFRRARDSIPKNKVKGLLRLRVLRLLEIAGVLLPWLSPLASRAHRYKWRQHDRFVAKEIERLEGIDIFVGWAGSCMLSLKAAKKRGIITVMECGSTFPSYQRRLLEEEYGLATGRSLRRSRDQMKVSEQIEAELRGADMVSYPSGFVKSSLLENGLEKERLFYAPYGVSLEEFRPVPKKDDVFRVVWCGTLMIRKGIHYLLQAFHELDLPKTELLLIGGVAGEIRPFLDRYKSPNIKAIGPRRQSQLYRYYSQGSVFVHPSVEEGLSMVQLEAMACGLPVICTTNTGGADIVRDDVEGFVIPIRDVEALKRKIRVLYDDPSLLRQMSKNAMERAKSFTWDNYGQQTVKAYQRILQNAK